MIPVLRVKPGTTFTRIAPAGFRILGALDTACRTIARDLVITAGTNDHPSGDPHARGEAYDVSVQGLEPALIARLVAHLRYVLGVHFTVLYEVPSSPSHPTLKAIAYINTHATGPHLHVQPVKGSVYPPVDATDDTVHT